MKYGTDQKTKSLGQTPSREPAFFGIYFFYFFRWHFFFAAVIFASLLLLLFSGVQDQGTQRRFAMFSVLENTTDLPVFVKFGVGLSCELLDCDRIHVIFLNLECSHVSYLLCRGNTGHKDIQEDAVGLRQITLAPASVNKNPLRVTHFLYASQRLHQLLSQVLTPILSPVIDSVSL